MRKRDLIADAFFEGVSAFSEKSGARGFDSRAEYSGPRKKGDLTKMICIASYADYDIEYVYTAVGGISFCSVFSFRIIFDRSMPYVKYSPYDIMYKIDDTNFRCYTFSYIESPEKMKQVITALEPELSDLLPKLNALCQRKADMSDIFDKFSDGVNAHYGRDIFRAADADDEDFEHFIESYYVVDDAFYVSKPYAQFLRGDYNSAYNGMRRIKNKSYYQIRLMSFIASLDHRYEAVPEDCDTTGEAVFSNKTQVVRTVIAALLLLLPCAAALAGIHYLSSALIYRGALWSDAWFFLQALRYVSSSVIPAFVFSWYCRGVTLIFFKPERRKYLSALDRITVNKRRTGCLSVAAGAITAMLVISVVITANSYAAFYDDGLRLPSETSLFSSDNYAYSDVEKLVCAEGSYNIYGIYVPGEQYIIELKNGKQYILSYEVTGSIVKEKIIPVLEEKGVPTVTVHDADDIDFIP
ncbi:MAG: hypothetical protein IJT49_08860 [Clostridia bacterium]|nr:hypothetical protein [Clostridia bacterium]